ncbi:flagellar transcriptional regulator FlhD [Eoetvoesiella caeni]
MFVYDPKSEIKEFNLAYLTLARKLINQDVQSAIQTLSIKQDVAEMMMSLSTEQVERIAAGSVVLGAFALDDYALLSQLSRGVVYSPTVPSVPTLNPSAGPEAKRAPFTRKMKVATC